MHRQLAEIDTAADKLLELNDKYQDRTIDQLARQIKSLIEQLNKE